jgi:hypothetical protein
MQPRTVYGDAAYGSGQFLDRLAGVDSRRKTQRPTAAGGMFTFTKDQFTVNLDDDTVTCPAGNTASSIRRGRDGDGTGRPPSPLRCLHRLPRCAPTATAHYGNSPASAGLVEVTACSSSMTGR